MFTVMNSEFLSHQTTFSLLAADVVLNLKTELVYSKNHPQ